MAQTELIIPPQVQKLVVSYIPTPETKLCQKVPQKYSEKLIAQSYIIIQILYFYIPKTNLNAFLLRATYLNLVKSFWLYLNLCKDILSNKGRSVKQKFIKEHSYV